MLLSRRALAPVVLALALSPALAACGGSDAEPAPAAEEAPQATESAAAELLVTDVWARASADGQANGAAYLTISGGGADDRLLAASVPSSIAARTELHETVVADTGGEGAGEGMDGMESGGEMSMRPVTAIDVPAGGTVSLEPGGLHVMLLELAAPLTAGQTFELTLQFEQAGEQVVPITVRDA